MNRICCYVWPHDKPMGTREMLHLDEPLVEDVDGALRVLDSVYDRLRHRYASQLSERPGNAVFQIVPDPPRRGASFQVSFARPTPYARVVDELNAMWLSNRRRLGDDLVA